MPVSTHAQIGVALRTLIENNGLNTKLIGYEHNWVDASAYPVDLVCQVSMADSPPSILSWPLLRWIKPKMHLTVWHSIATQAASTNKTTSIQDIQRKRFTWQNAQALSGPIGGRTLNGTWTIFLLARSNIIPIRRWCGILLVTRTGVPSSLVRTAVVIPGVVPWWQWMLMEPTIWIKNVHRLFSPLPIFCILISHLYFSVYAMAHASKAILPKDVGGPWGKKIGVSLGGLSNSTLRVGAYHTGRAKSSDSPRYSLVVLNWNDNSAISWNPTPVEATIEFRGRQVSVQHTIVQKSPEVFGFGTHKRLTYVCHRRDTHSR